MIMSIDSINNLGIYRNYKRNNDLKDFTIFNLFYGWNGCGKSTLSKIFRSLETKQLPNGFENPKFELTLDDGLKISSENLQDFKESIYVYNTDFVNENIDWNNRVNSILILSKQNIEDTNEFYKLREELNGNRETGTEGLIKKLNDKKLDIENLNRDIEGDLTKIAKNIKNNLVVISTNDNYYTNYKKDKLRKLIKDKEDKLRNYKKVLTQQEISNLINQAKPEMMETITCKLNNIGDKIIKNLIDTIKEIINRKVTAQVIERLKQNPDISEWVQSGIALHKRHSSVICEFCGQPLSADRINKLENHFNDQIKKLELDIENILKEIGEQKLNYNDIKIDEHVFYPEYIDRVKECNSSISDLINQINEIFQDGEKTLNEKHQNPFKKIDFKENNINDLIEKYNSQISTLNGLIMAHNDKTKNFDIKVNNAKKELELYYAQEQLRDNKYFENLKLIDDQYKEFNEMEENINKKSGRFNELESKLSNETLGAEQFNKEIAEFMGYSEIELKFNKNKKGYEIIRKTDNKPAHNLSEGEKSAIAFVYFINKLKENGNKIEDSIIVVDDPISSFDSNKLFNAFAYLKNRCNNSKQLFVLTHNFNYFKLIRQWFYKNNRRSNGNQYYNLYEIETKYINGLREGIISNAGSALNNTSEYDYIFKKVYEYSQKSELTQDEMYNSANIARKLVEAFLSFKYPRQRGNISSLLNKAFPEETISSIKIYNFLNTYSHDRKIDVACDLADDNMLAESGNIMKDILDMIKKIDKQHYDDMINIVSR